MTARLDNDDNVVMSVDIVGSTSLYESVGDAKAQELVGDSLVVIKDICAEHGAVVVGEAGDEVVCVVSDATEAASAASEIHAALFEQYGKEEKTPVRVRIGLHFGPAPASADALMSETTKIAKWAQGNAKPEQTLATRAVIDQLPRIFRAVSRYVDDETWNFVSLEHVELHEVVWDVESITAFNGEAPRPDSQDYKSVEFTYGDACVVVDVGHPVISIGRGAQNDLVVPNDLVSRQHLRAQFSRGRCTITDNSTNGTVIIVEGGDRYEIKRESFRLMGSGIVVPGHPPEQQLDFEITFHCK